MSSASRIGSLPSPSLHSLFCAESIDDIEADTPYPLSKKTQARPPSPPSLTGERVSEAISPKRLKLDEGITPEEPSDELFDVDNIDSSGSSEEENNDVELALSSDGKRLSAFPPAVEGLKKLKKADPNEAETSPSSPISPAKLPTHFRFKVLKPTVELGIDRFAERPLNHLVRSAEFISSASVRYLDEYSSDMDKKAAATSHGKKAQYAKRAVAYYDLSTDAELALEKMDPLIARRLKYN